MIRGFIIGASIVGFLWIVQWNSLGNQETRAYHEYMSVKPLEPMDYYPPDAETLPAPKKASNRGPYFLTVGNL